MENKIPTTEDVMIPYFLYDNEDKDLIKSAMIEFAKLHVEAALKGCLNKYHHASEENYDFGSSEIMNAYSLTNIK
jgi:hypothetical protein